MKNKFVESDIGKSFKLYAKPLGKNSFLEFKGVFLGFYLTGNDIPYKQESIYGFFEGSDRTEILKLNEGDFKDIKATRLPKEVGDRGRFIVKSINKTIKDYSILNKESYKLLNKLEQYSQQDIFTLVKKIINKYPNKDSLFIVNQLFKIILPRLEISNITEDYDEYDMEEYGVYDLEDTRHLSLDIHKTESSSYIVKEYFSLNNFRINGDSEIRKIAMLYPNFNLKHAMIINNFVDVVVKCNK